MARQVALDIEAVPTTDEPRFNDASAWAPFAIAVSFRSEVESMPERVVFVRADESATAERKMLAAVANWIHDHRPVDALLTFNGGELRPDADGFDLPILAHRIDTELGAHDEALAGYVRDALDAPHRDLFKEIIDNQPESEKWPSLKNALSSRGLVKTPARLDGEEIGGADMPDLGARLLSGEGLSRQQERALREYASSDVVPLHPLSDELRRERQASTEAEAVTDGGRE